MKNKAMETFRIALFIGIGAYAGHYHGVAVALKKFLNNAELSCNFDLSNHTLDALD